MYVLVDYANVRGRFGRKPIDDQVSELIEKIIPFLESIPERVQFRFYGGWYEDQTLTKLAQELTSELQQAFPSFVKPIVGGGKKIRVSAELAYSMLVDPDYHLVRTVREGSTHRSVRMQSPKTNGCKRTDCSIRGIKGFFSKGRCTYEGCSMRASDLLGAKREQKLVDTMLTADVLYISSGGAQSLVLVSSDDDMIPAVRQALLDGVHITHVHTGPHESTPSHYLPKAYLNYTQTSIDT